MGIISEKKGGLALLSSDKEAESHRIRLISHAKKLEIDYVSINPDALPSDLLEINPTGKLPTLLDRDLVLVDERVMSEYIDERFPHPALMPIEADLRAKIRILSINVEQSWYPLYNSLEHDKLSSAKRKTIIKELKEAVLVFAPLVRGKKYAMGEDLSLLDCCVLPILWRLKSLGVELPDNNSAQMLKTYMLFQFKQEYFKASLSKYEMALND